MSDDQQDLKQLIFRELGIKDVAPWKHKSVTGILTDLRESAGLTPEDMAKALGTGAENILRMEQACAPVPVQRLLPLLKKGLQARLAEGWLDPRSLTIQTETFAEVAEAAELLRSAERLSVEKYFLKTGVNTAELQPYPQMTYVYEDAQPSPFIGMVQAAKKLFDHYGLSSVADLRQEALDIKELAPLPRWKRKRPETRATGPAVPDPAIPTLDEIYPESATHYSASRNEAIGTAVHALIEYLGLKQSCLEERGVLSRANTNAFVHGYGYRPTKETIEKMPEALMQSYRLAHEDKNPDEAARCANVAKMMEKGARLANLNHEHMRAGVWRLLQERGMSRHDLADASGLSYGAIREYLKGDHIHSNLSTGSIARMVEPLGVADIFALESAGRFAREGEPGFLEHENLRRSGQSGSLEKD